jgi:glucose-6-phosphate isomerase
MISGIIFTFAFGFETYRKLLMGAHRMDRDALQPDLFQNLPLLGAFLNLWNHNFLGYSTLAIIPYAHALRYWAAHIQQVEMESNGKSIDKEGNRLHFESAPVIWGEPGTNAQHSFFQMIHQGTSIVPLEFIGCKSAQRKESDPHSQKMVLANLAAQSMALACGSQNENPNKRFFGNRPSHILFTEKLTPESLGALLAYYEHKVAFEGMLLGINSFDQPGVELGKALATRFLALFGQSEKGEKLEYRNGAEKFLFELIR